MRITRKEKLEIIRKHCVIAAPFIVNEMFYMNMNMLTSTAFPRYSKYNEVDGTATIERDEYMEALFAWIRGNSDLRVFVYDKDSGSVYLKRKGIDSELRVVLDKKYSEILMEIKSAKEYARLQRVVKKPMAQQESKVKRL